MKKVIIDKFVPFEGNPFEGIATIQQLAPAEITTAAVKDADALIVRTRTKCNAALLDGSKVSIVATATIGTDHFDFPYLASKGIKAVSAPGCNAPAVAQYVLASIFKMGLGQPGMRLGVIGVGHVGSIVASWARHFGIEVLACDPPRRERDGGWDAEAPFEAGGEPFLQLEEVARKADVLTFHTPLTTGGAAPSFHLGSHELFNIAPKAMVINAARGPVFDTEAIISALRRGKVAHAAIDCWEGEPKISTELMRLAEISTPHIAGYSIEGKTRATAITFNAVLSHFGSERRIDPNVPMTPPAAVDKETLIASYDPIADSELLKSSPETFEHLRDSYPLRHEVKF
jgi:erythronate-4-phosphate dehydrogenase